MPDNWQPPPDGWAAYRAAQDAACEHLGWGLDWNGQTYVVWRPGWSYAEASTLTALCRQRDMAPLARLIDLSVQLTLWKEAA